MPIKLRSGSWKDGNSIYLRVSGAWKSISSGYIRVSGSWKQFFASTVIPSTEAPSEITLSAANATTGLRTLTGKHYHWLNTNVLYYNYQRSTDSVNWTSMASGTATNPGSGSSTTSPTINIQNNGTHVQANTTNYYRYATTGENTTYSTQASSFSSSVTIEGPRDITGLTASAISSTSITISWSGGTYGNSFRINYAAGSSNFDSSVDVSSSPYTLTGLSPSTTYYFAVRPYTGSLVSNTVTGYYGNLSNTVNATTQAAPVPTQISGPSISGSGVWFTSMSATGGTYSNASSVSTRIRGIFAPNSPQSGVAYSSEGFGGATFSTPKIVTQADTKTPAYIFYAQDVVVGLGGTTYYFWSATKLNATKDYAQDTYSRTVNNGLGTATPTRNASLDPNSWIYDSGLNLGIFSVNGSVALSSESVGFSEAPGNVPKQAIEWSKDNVSVQASLPTGGGGSGVTFWLTSSGSWWAVVPNYYYQQNSSTTTTYSWGTNQYVGVCCSCTGTGFNYTGCPASGYFNGGLCSACNIETTYNCTGISGKVLNGTQCCTASNPPPLYSTVYTNCQPANVVTKYSYNYYVLSPVLTCSGAGGSNTTGCPATGSGEGEACGCTSTPTTSYSTTYYSRIVIYSGNGSSIVSKAQQILASPTYSSQYDGVSYTKIFGISASTNGNTITARGFSDTGLSTQLGSTLTYTANASDLSFAPKSLASGKNSAGIIIGPTDANASARWDNLYIS